MNQKEIANVDGSDIMTENHNTTHSQLAPHRYVPYHFKGLDTDTKEHIMAVRAQQLRENRTAKQMEEEEERQWAM